MAFFACYHKLGRNYYWDTNNKLSECADLLRAHRCASEKSREAEIIAAYREQVKAWKGPCTHPTTASVLYGRPVLASDKCEWFNNGRHIIFVEPEKCLSIASAMTQARDYMLAPADKDLAPQGTFSARVRHLIAPIHDTQDLAPYWDTFVRAT